MNTIILIPSKNRSFQLECETGQWLFNAGFPYKIIVEPQNLEEYSKKFGADNMLPLKENDKGMEYAQFHGKQFALENGYDFIFKIDDDIHGWATIFKGDTKNNTERFQLLMQEIQKPMEHPSCAGISFGYRQEFWHDKQWLGVNQRFQTCYVVRTNLYRPLEQGYSMGMWEDMINFLRVIEDGHKVLRYGRYLMDTEVESGMPGGLTDYYKKRTPEQYASVIENLRKEFPWLPFRQKDDGRIEPDFNNPVVAGKKL